MEQHHQVLPNFYLHESFIGGKAIVKSFIKAFKPVSVTKTIMYVRI